MNFTGTWHGQGLGGGFEMGHRETPTIASSIDRSGLRNVHANDSQDSAGLSLKARAEAVAEIAARHASSVDRDSRFPAEAFAAAREFGLLGALVPESLGGPGVSTREIADVCFILGRACSATGLIFAMHQVKVACLVRHNRGDAWQESFLRRVATGQMLLASSTTEGNGGGNIRSSEAAVQVKGDRIELTRAAAVISYGEHADGIVTTARRAEGSASSDQVLVVFSKDDYTLERTNSWDTLGMRGTCSIGFVLRASGVPAQVLAEPYERIHSQTMMPVAHIFWGSVWTGIATAAVQRARGFVRAASRSSGGVMPPAAAHLTRARVNLETLRGRLQAGIKMFESRAGDPVALTGIEVQTAMNFLKVEISELALAIVMAAMRTCGLSGFRNDTEFSIGRLLRDILSAPIMINNDRILSNAEMAVLMSEVPGSLSE
jgi:acyl-CoA dehydrogenase